MVEKIMNQQFHWKPLTNILIPKLTFQMISTTTTMAWTTTRIAMTTVTVFRIPKTMTIPITTTTTSSNLSLYLLLDFFVLSDRQTVFRCSEIIKHSCDSSMGWRTRYDIGLIVLNIFLFQKRLFSVSRLVINVLWNGLVVSIITTELLSIHSMIVCKPA